MRNRANKLPPGVRIAGLLGNYTALMLPSFFSSVLELITKTSTELPPDVRLLVIADHGMVDSPRSSRVDVDAEVELRDGLFLMGGEARFRHLYCRNGALDEVAATWRAVLGDRADVLTREEAIGRGWFGAVEP